MEDVENRLLGRFLEVEGVILVGVWLSWAELSGGLVFPPALCVNGRGARCCHQGDSHLRDPSFERPLQLL